jgi:dTDP-4-dehydrorhamnose reductase
MKIAIIGAYGTLGQQLVKTFKIPKHVIYAYDTDSLDILDFKTTYEKLKKENFDIIINSAAYNDVDKSETDGKDSAFRLNAEAVLNLARVCKESNCLFIHYSTDYVFDGSQITGYKETDIPNPISAYGKSKFQGETNIQNTIDNFYIIRLSKLFGPPPTTTNSKKSFVDKIVELSFTKKELSIVNEQFSSPTYSIDLAEKTKFLIDNEYSYGIYHITNTGACTWYEFAKKIFQIKNINTTVNPIEANAYPRPAKIPKYSQLLNTKLPNLRTWEDALYNYLNC